MMIRIALLLCLLSGCITVPKEITINVRHQERRELPDGAYNVLPAVRPEGESKSPTVEK